MLYFFNDRAQLPGSTVVLRGLGDKLLANLVGAADIDKSAKHALVHEGLEGLAKLCVCGLELLDVVLHPGGFGLETIDLPDRLHEALDEPLIVDIVENFIPDQAVYVIGLPVCDGTGKRFPGLLGFLPGDRAGIALEVSVEHAEILGGALEIAHGCGPVFRAKRNDEVGRGTHGAPFCNKIGKGDDMAPHENAGHIAVQGRSPFEIAVYGRLCADNRGEGCAVGAIMRVRDPGNRHIAMRSGRPQEVAEAVAARDV